MTGEAIVVSVCGDKAIVKISKSSACGHDCASCKACSNPSYEISVINKIGAKVGDKVLIETKTSKVLFASFLLYILPVVLLILGAVILEENPTGLWNVFVFIPLVLVWLLIIRLTNKKLKIKNEIVAFNQKD